MKKVGKVFHRILCNVYVYSLSNSASFANGEVYEGEYKDDKKHGQGKRTWADGNVYEGEWKDHKKHGQGKYTWADGEVYEGEYKDCMRHGQGKCTFARITAVINYTHSFIVIGVTKVCHV